MLITNPIQQVLAFAIIKDGETVYKSAMGLANVEYNIPITDSTAF